MKNKRERDRKNERKTSNRQETNFQEREREREREKTKNMKKDKIVEARGDNGVLKRIVELFERKRKNWKDQGEKTSVERDASDVSSNVGIKKLNFALRVYPQICECCEGTKIREVLI